jgi:hypothetical protein
MAIWETGERLSFKKVTLYILICPSNWCGGRFGLFDVCVSTLHKNLCPSWRQSLAMMAK